jgi:23S rRNA pseudouridine2605 synthase
MRKTEPSGGRPVRLQKFLSDAGVASRRHAEELIQAGRVLVNDEIVDELPAFVDPHKDRVIVDGRVVHIQRHRYFIMNKPRGVVCTNRDPAGRTRAVDLLPPMAERLFVVGRLDAESTGLLLMTNDGELAEEILHPRYGISKVYRVKVQGRVSAELPAQMARGVYLSEGKATAAHVEITHSGNAESVLNIMLREGRNRQVRRMLARLGHRVKALKRLKIGSLDVRGLPEGACRALSPAEVNGLREAVAEARGQAAKAGRSRAIKAKAPQRKKRAGDGRPAKGEAKRGKAAGAGKPRRGSRETESGPSRRIIT